jgi:hypothetical protein
MSARVFIESPADMDMSVPVAATLQGWARPRLGTVSFSFSPLPPSGANPVAVSVDTGTGNWSQTVTLAASTPYTLTVTASAGGANDAVGFRTAASFIA